MRKRNLAAVLMTILSLQLAHAHNQACVASVSGGSKSQDSIPGHLRLDPGNHHRNQSIILEHAKGMGLPAFVVSLASGDHVPVLLLNKHTIQAWSPILEQTVGLNQSLHPNNPANHGWLRLPGAVDYKGFEGWPGKLYENGIAEGVLVDLFSPAQSADQAINGNGYRWKQLSDYFQRRHQGSFVHIEQVFALSKDDQIRVWLYHAAKRSALVRIQYMFDRHNNDWIRAQRRVLQQDGEYNRRGYGEHCNNCRIGATAGHHAAEMRGRMAGLFNKDVNHIYSLSETHQFLNDAKKKLLYANWRSAESMHPDLMNDDYFMNLMHGHFREGLSREQQVDALSYLLATNIFEEVAVVKQKYKMEEEVAMSLGNPKMSAFIVYSDLFDSPESFYKAQFEYFGANGAGFSSHWPGLNPRGLYQNWPENWWEKWRPR